MSSPTERPAKRARSAVACRRCKHRKQRCDNSFPSCTNCLSANEACLYDTSSKVHPPEYVASLEQRVAELERRGQADGRDEPGPQTRDAANNAFEMLSATSPFLGTSSGYPLAQTLQSAIIGGLSTRGVDEIEGTTTSAAREAGTPDDALGRRLIRVYLTKVHPKHPFLSARRLSHLHESRESLPSGSSEESSITRLKSFTLYMVYAIGARYHQLSQNEYICSPDAYYSAAMKDVTCVFQHDPTLETLEGMLLLVLFQLRSSRPAEIWSMVGITMRHAISLGLHRRYSGPRVIDQRRKRLFWTLYMLERSVARTMGRPMSISDQDIDVELPMNVDENIDNESDMLPALEQDRGLTTMSALIHIFRLTRLESKIYSTVHRVDIPVTAIPVQEVASLRQALENWRNEIPTYVPTDQEGREQETDNSDDESPLINYYATPTYQILHYHLALLLLLLPSLTNLPQTHPDFQSCLISAGQVCQLYKRLHDRQTVLAYSLIALHATFVAGLTLVYCFLADPSVVTSHPYFHSDLRACSNVLYIISERWPTARKVRTAFERILRKTVESEDAVRAKKSGASIPAIGQEQDANALNTVQSDATLWADIMADQLPTATSSAYFGDGTAFEYQDDIWNALGPWFVS